MLQYIINMTAIWLVSLTVFDAFLRREGYHGYNRAYLLFTFVLGMALPLLRWRHSATLYIPAGRQAYTAMLHTAGTAAGTVPAAGGGQGISWLLIVYLAGAAAACLLLLREAVKLALLYRRGQKMHEGGLTIIETGGSHTPFSFGRVIFAGSRGSYSAGEWQIILLHEARHAALWHLADMLLLQAARIVFWFHPLVYMYGRRLLLVHEYQADSRAAQDKQVYCRFLLEQAMLQGTPAIAHSFYSSPIKNRIMMLTKNSPRARFAKTKLLLTLPLTAVCMLCFTPEGYPDAKVKNGNKIIYKGNVFELVTPEPVIVEMGPDVVIGHEIVAGSTPPPIAGGNKMPGTAGGTVTIQANMANGRQDTITYKTGGKTPEAAPATNEVMMQVVPYPATMNGEKIYNECDVAAKPIYKTGEKSLEDYVLQHMQGAMRSLPDGDYSVDADNIVIDKKGHVTYYDNNGLTDTKHQLLRSPEVMKAIDELMEHAPAYTPARDNDNKAVLCKMPALLRHASIIVKDHVPGLKHID